ncbi:MAG TPA: type II toxin-antitoxin system prevent-host-death family antitoxin [Ilumatobacter sp.]|nr:type II toxin-antitoxin system prevent-host-death family antitoxin [Ilumatobacter sp.]
MTNVAYVPDDDGPDLFTTRVNIAEAKAKLSELVDIALQPGRRVVICRNGTPYVELTPVNARPRRNLGFLDLDLPDEMFEPLQGDELELWYS